MRVRKGGIYKYVANMLDQIDARTDLQNGELVKVIQLPSSPPPNTMNHAHVERLNGKFAGLVSTHSLENP